MQKQPQPLSRSHPAASSNAAAHVRLLAAALAAVVGLLVAVQWLGLPSSSLALADRARPSSWGAREVTAASGAQTVRHRPARPAPVAQRTQPPLTQRRRLTASPIALPSNEKAPISGRSDPGRPSSAGSGPTSVGGDSSASTQSTVPPPPPASPPPAPPPPPAALLPVELPQVPELVQTPELPQLPTPTIPGVAAPTLP
jgi:hypothetical protein